MLTNVGHNYLTILLVPLFSPSMQKTSVLCVRERKAMVIKALHFIAS